MNLGIMLEKRSTESSIKAESRAVTEAKKEFKRLYPRVTENISEDDYVAKRVQEIMGTERGY